MSIKHIIEANGWTFTIVFLTLSLAAVALVVWRLLLNFHAKTNLPDFLGRLEQAYAAGGPQAALQMCEAEPGLVGKLFATAIRIGPQGKVAARKAMEEQVELELEPSLNRLLPAILLCIRIAPMLGLLGTVVGMIFAFQKIAGATKVEPSALANDIGMALFTTAEGLIIAIPLMFAHAMFKEQVHKFQNDLQHGLSAAMEMIPRMFPRT
jgi:biopolymer transport protein ExbB